MRLIKIDDKYFNFDYLIKAQIYGAKSQKSDWITLSFHGTEATVKVSPNQWAEILESMRVIPFEVAPE